MNHLERLRVAKGKTQQQMADICEMSLRGYRKVEKSEALPSYRVTVSLQRYFNVIIDYLLEQEVDAPSE